MGKRKIKQVCVMTSPNAYIIVVGNEKGGCGKTTISMHLAVSLLYEGLKVATIDLDARQRTLSRYVENRRHTAETEQLSIPFTSHFIVKKSTLDTISEAEADEQSRFEQCLQKAAEENDVILVDAPGNDTFLSRLAHSYANTIVTPINDSFLDLDVLAHVKENTLDMSRPGVYSEIVWQAKIQRAKRDKGEVDWVVLRNRLSNLDAQNKRQMSDALDKFSRKTGCRIAQGLSERVIYRELFLKGMTLLDLMHEGAEVKLRMSHVAARQELRELVHFLDLKYRIKHKSDPAEKAEENVSALSAPESEPAPTEINEPKQGTSSEAATTEAAALAKHHYSLEELERIEAEIEEKEGLVDTLEDLNKIRKEPLGLGPASTEPEAEISAGETEETNEAADPDSDEGVLKEESRQRLARMLEETKRVLEAENASSQN